ncbi:MAG TPA: co-chaperone DjlA [Cellvibrio sp.]|nr:co-chaperone DjlA [Cellvibrio sp.]
MMVYITILVLGLIAFYVFSARGIFVAKNGTLSGSELNSVQDLFFRTVFTLLGYVAKRDGPVNAREVKRTETFMEKMDLNANRKREAIRLFKSGADPQFKVQPTLDKFKGLARKSPNLAQILLVYLINLARVDGALVNKEVEAVEEVAFGLGYTNITFKHLLKMIASQDSFSESIKAELKGDKGADNQKPQSDSWKSANDNKKDGTETRHKSGSHTKDDDKPVQDADESCEEKTKDFQGEKVSLRSAYDVLDVAPGASNAELKKAYRSLVSQYHPDKLIGLGLPPYMVNAATECFKTIQAAYDYIQKARAH